MIYKYRYLLGFILIILMVLLCNLVNKINLKSFWSKQIYLKANRIISLDKDSYILVLRALIYMSIAVLSAVTTYIIFKLDWSILYIYRESTLGQSFALLIITAIVSIKIFFLLTTIIISVIKKKNVQNYITDMKWIESNEKYRVYTKVIRTIIIGSIDGIAYCVIFNGIGTSVLGMNFLLTTLIVSIYCGIGKTLLMKQSDKKIIMFLYGFCYCFAATLLYGATGNFINPIILFILGTSFWVFKR